MDLSSTFKIICKHYNNLKDKIKNIELNNNIITIIPSLLYDCFCIKVAQNPFDEDEYLIKIFFYIRDCDDINYDNKRCNKNNLINSIELILYLYKYVPEKKNILNRALKNLKFKAKYKINNTILNDTYNYILSFKNYFIKILVIIYNKNHNNVTIKFDSKSYDYELLNFELSNLLEMIDYIQEKLDSY